MIIFSINRVRHLRRLFTCLCGLIIFLSSGQSFASDEITPDQCCSCHSEVCDEKDTKIYVHAPVQENNCTVCHIKNAQASSDQQDTQETAVKTIEWFSLKSYNDSEHWFELPDQSAGAILSLQASTPGKTMLEQDVEIPPLNHIQSFSHSGNNPIISNHRVIETKKGVFISAQIGWTTDRITDAKLIYTLEGTESTTATESRLETEHELYLTGLERNKQYSVKAVSHDINGNKTISPPLNFSTQDFYTTKTPEQATSLDPIDLTTSFFQEKEKIFVHFKANQPVTMRLGFDNSQFKQNQAENDVADLPTEHLELTDVYTNTITVCITCHPDSKGERSHPVDIPAESGMAIPDNYKTLPNGNLSCMTCHQAHASNNDYRLTRPNRKDLCVGCHLNF